MSNACPQHVVHEEGQEGRRHEEDEGLHHQSFEFLPICDMMFNIISLAAYFGDVVFDVIRVHSLYSDLTSSDEEGEDVTRMRGSSLHVQRLLFPVMLILLISSSLISQYLSIHWFIRSAAAPREAGHVDQDVDPEDDNDPHHVSCSGTQSQSPESTSSSCCYDNRNASAKEEDDGQHEDDATAGDRHPNPNQGSGQYRSLHQAHHLPDHQEDRQQEQHHYCHPSSPACRSNHNVSCTEKQQNNSISLPVRCQAKSACSFLWSRVREVRRVQWTRPGNATVLLIHVMQLGILWRYVRLCVPVNVMTVKHEVRDLVMLRMVHAFCQAGPMLLIQVFLMLKRESGSSVPDLDIVSASLSLVTVCWALASFNKNARRKNVHKLILTWFGVIFQFMWRIGSVFSQIVDFCFTCR